MTAASKSFAAGAERLKALLHTFHETTEAQLDESNGEDTRDYGVLADMIEAGFADAYSQEPDVRWGFSLALADLFARVVDGAGITPGLWDPMKTVARSCKPPTPAERRLSMTAGEPAAAAAAVDDIKSAFCYELVPMIDATFLLANSLRVLDELNKSAGIGPEVADQLSRACPDWQDPMAGGDRWSVLTELGRVTRLRAVDLGERFQEVAP